MKKRIPDFYLEQYRLGEADEETARAIRADSDALARVADLERDSDEILGRYPAEEMARTIRGRLERVEREEAWAHRQASRPASARRRERLVRLWETIRDGLNSPVVAIGAVAALVLALLPIFLAEGPDIGETGEVTAGIERIKGLDPALRVYRQSGPSDAEILTDGSTAYEGDRLQIAYRAAGFRYGAIFSIDGSGYVTLHYPETPERSGDLTQEGEVPLPFAYVLDDAPSFESFFMVLSEEELDVAALISSIEAGIAGSDGDPETVAATVERAVRRIDGHEVTRLERLDLRKYNGE